MSVTAPPKPRYVSFFMTFIPSKDIKIALTIIAYLFVLLRLFLLLVELLILSCGEGVVGVVGVMMVAEPGDDATLTTAGRFEDGADVAMGDVTLLVDPLPPVIFLGDDTDDWWQKMKPGNKYMQKQSLFFGRES